MQSEEIVKRQRKKKTSSDEPKFVKWHGCPACGCSDAPDVVCTNVHVTWGTTLQPDGTLKRKKSHKQLGELPEVTCLICTKCGFSTAENILVSDGLGVIRNPNPSIIKILKCDKCGNEIVTD
jgi:hypothetical protein